MKLGLAVDTALQTNVLREIDGGARVHHRFNEKLSGPVRIFEKFVVRASTQERNIVFDALKASFEK